MATLARRNQGWLPLFFNDFFRDDRKVGTGSTVPAVNVKENEHAYTIEVAAAGMTKDDINIDIDDDDDNDLVITMEKKNESKDENKEGRYLRREFSYSKFQQIMILPDNIDKEKIEAKVENGILLINLPKFSEKEMQKKQRSIAVG